MKNRNIFKLGLAVGIILLAAVLRLYKLGDFPLFFDESVHYVIVEQLIKGNYAYDPAYHAPLLYYSLAPFVSVLGKNEFALRLLPAILGVLFVASIFLYKRYIGDKAYIAALFVAISPIIVNYSRFCRTDIYVLLFTSLALYFILRYFEKEKSFTEFKIDRDTGFAVAAAVFLGLFASIKETFYVFIALLGLYLIFDIKKMRLSDLLIACLSFFGVYVMFYTYFFSDFSVITDFSNFPAVRAFEYWKGQHEIARIAGPWYYHLELLLLYDFPALCLAGYTLYRVFRGDKDTFTALFAYLFLANLVFFSYMQEKVPWLVVHIEFPMFMIAAKAIDLKREGWKDKVALLVTVAFLLYGSAAINVVNPVNYAEPALYLPTQYDVKKAEKFPDEAMVCLYTTVAEYHPLVFYLKAWCMGDLNNPTTNADVIIANQTASQKLESYLTGWDREKMVVRCWSFWTQPKIEKIPEFLAFRKPFADVGCMNFTVYYSPDFEELVEDDSKIT
ncbi:flippase activity-associated protein Agl23 [Archaeoglobus sp.]